jgi:PAS domain S-box-containing protein
MPKPWLTAQCSSLTSKLNLVVLIAGGLAVVLGGVGLFGWYTHSPWILQVRPTFAPMQYNAALSVSLGGLGLLALSWGRTRLATVCGIVVAAIGFLTLYEYLFGLSLGLDQLFFHPFTTVRTSHPGRMAPQTALSCLLTGTVLVILCRPASHGLVRLFPGLLSLPVGGLGLVGSFGYVTGTPTAYQWQPFTDMSVLCAVGCVVLGAGMMAAAWRHYGIDTSGPSPWAPVFVGGCVILVTLSLWQALLAHESVLVRRTVTLTATSIQDAITEQIVSRLRSLERMAQHWEAGGVFSPEVWEQDAALLRRYDPYLQGVVWVDASFQVRELGPLADEGTLSQPQLLALAQTTKDVQVTRVKDAGSVDQEIWMVVPSVTAGTFQGCLIGMLRLQPFLTYIATRVAEDFAVVVLEGEEPIYARHQTTELYKDTLRQEVVITLPGLTWRVWVWPTAGATLVDTLSALPFVVLLMGLVTTVLLAALAYFAQTAQSHATQLGRTNAALTKEISERQRTEAALRQLSKVFRDATDPILIEDLDGHIVDLNVEAERAYGWTRAELLGHSSTTLVPPTYHAYTDALFARCRAGEIVRNIETIHWTKTGEQVPVLLTLSVLTDDTATPIAVATLAKHITELKRVEEALRDSYQFLQSTLDALSASIVILEETGTIIAVNAAWRRFVLAHDLSASAHGVNTSYLEFCHAVNRREGTDFQEFLTGLQAVMARQYPAFSWEYACHSTPEPSWFLLQVTRFDEIEGGRVVIAHEDISEIKRAEDVLRRQQEALHQSEKLAAMSGLLASVAHELNNPLAAILVQSDLLREQAMENDLAEVVTEMHQAAVRCERIVRNFLTLARPNTPERTRVQLNDVIQEALQLLRYTLQLDEIDVVQQLADDLPVLWGDPYQLHQVVVNLLTNAHYALQQTPPPQRITLTTQYDVAQQAIRLEVRDTGPGIPLALQARIFEPFFTTKPTGVGTGLGLSLCQSIIAGHEGTLHIESPPGQGTRFVVTLPVAVGPCQEPPVPEPLPSAHMTGKTILVIDDEVGTAKALVRLFHRDGHNVDTAADGHLALAQLRERPYDLILCDLRMPKLDGPGLYRSLAQDQPQLLPRFIFVTGDTLSPTAKAFLEDSQAPYLVKPFHAEEVRQVVQQALHRLEGL